MSPEEEVALDCPCCDEPIYRPLSWFRKPYTTCPHCQAGLAATQFETRIDEIEAAFAAADDELVHGAPAKGGCCGRH